MVLLHLVVLLFNKLISTMETTGKWSCPLKVVKWILNKSFNILTFGYYIRYILEMNQLILISSVYEIYSFSSSQPLKIISFVCAIFIFIACIILIVFVAFLSLSSYEVTEGNHNKLEEIFSGVKMQKKYKLYVTALLIRRALFVILLITLESIPSRAVIGILTGFQLGYLAFITFIRPFSEIKCNIIEIMNEVYFLALLSSLIYLNTEDNWSQSKIDFYTSFLTSNTIMAFIIILVDMLKSGIFKLKQKCTNSEEKDPKVTPSNNSQIPSMIAIRDTQFRLKSEVDEKQNQDQSISRNDHYILEESKIHIEYPNMKQENHRINERI